MFGLPQEGCAEILPLGATRPWQLLRGSDLVLLRTDAWSEEDDRAAVHLGCLHDNLWALPAGERFVLDAECGLRLEKVIRLEALEVEVSALTAQWQACLLAMQEPAQPLPVLDDVPVDAQSSAVAGVEVALLQALAQLAAVDPGLSSMLVVDEAQGLAWFEPDEGTQIVLVLPLPDRDHLCLCASVLSLDSHVELDTILARALQLGSALVLGERFRLGTGPEGAELLLCVDFQPHLTDVASLQADLGALMKMADQMAELLVEHGPHESAETESMHAMLRS